MWETTKMPLEYYSTVSQFEQLIVPCDHNAELFAPFHKNISVVPLGIDVDLWQPQETPGKDLFRFVTGGSGWNRKGMDVVIEAFRQADLPDSELYIKVTPDLMNDPGFYDFGPNIHVVKKKMSVKEERSFYAAADCFVSGSRGEGFGMIPLQCRAQGTRIIAPAHTGHLMYQDLIDYPVGWHYSKAEIQHYDDIGDWYDPNVDEMVDAMRDAYRLGPFSLWERRNRWEDCHGWSWDNTADRLLEVFPAGGLVETEKWEQSGQGMVMVRTLSQIEADVGRYRLRFPANEVVEIPRSTLSHLLDCGVVTQI
jgi:glycosyltransferase involved in cell wall biosynthesis